MKVIKIGDCLYLSNRKIPSLDHVGGILRSGRGSVKEGKVIMANLRQPRQTIQGKKQTNKQTNVLRSFV